MNSYRKSIINSSDGKLFQRSTGKLPKWATKKPMISDVEYMTTATTNGNKKQENQVKKNAGHFSDPTTNTLVN